MFGHFVFIAERERKNDFRVARKPGIPEPQAEESDEHRGHRERNEFSASAGFFGDDAFLAGIGRDVNAFEFRLLGAIDRADVAELFHALETNRLATNHAIVHSRFAFVFGTGWGGSVLGCRGSSGVARHGHWSRGRGRRGMGGGAGDAQTRRRRGCGGRR